MAIAIEHLVEFGEAYSSAVDQGGGPEGATLGFCNAARSLLGLVTGRVPTIDEIHSVFPTDAHATDLEQTAISQVENPPSAHLHSTAWALLIEFGVTYWFAKTAVRHDPHGRLITSTKVLLWLLTNQSVLPEHIESAVPHDQALSDA